MAAGPFLISCCQGQAVRSSESAGVTETVWKLHDRSHWLSTAVRRRVTPFHPGPSRGAKELVRLVGRDYTGGEQRPRERLPHLPVSPALLAHLLRNAEGLALRGSVRPLGRGLV